MTEVIIPVKPLSEVKQRLSMVLTQQQRSHLVLAMLEDLLRALSSVANVQVSVVTSDTTVSKLAVQWGVRHIPEDVPQGYNAAVRLGLSRVASARGSSNWPAAVLPGDIPMASSAEITELIKPPESNNHLVRLVASRDRHGTNGLFLSNSGLLEPAYGYDSFHNYLQAARRARLTTEVLDLPGLALDIDTPDDLAVLSALESSSVCSVAFLQTVSPHRGIA